MQNQIDEMAKPLQQHNLTVPANAKKKDEDKPWDGGYLARNGHDLMDIMAQSSIFILYSVSLRHMVAEKEPLSSPENCTDPPIMLEDPARKLLIATDEEVSDTSSKNSEQNL